MRALIKGLAALAVALIFLLTLLLNWPLAALGTFFEREARHPTGLAGTLTDGHIERLAFEADGWPLALGPIDWEVDWPAGLSLTLGRAPGAWHADGQWRGTASHWRISGGDLSALDLANLPLALEARWEGTLDVTFRGQRCLSSQGGLTATRIALLSPTAVELGRGRLSLDCTGPTPRLLLDIEDGRALSISVAMTLSGAGGEAHVQGVIDEQHPLSQWRQRLQPDAPGERLDARFHW